MGSKPSCPLSDEEIQQLKTETGCSETRIKDLHVRFKELDRSNVDSLSRDDFLHIPEFVMNPLADRITHLFFQNPSVKDDGEERINFSQFIRTLAIFRPLTPSETKDSDAGASFVNSKKEKLRFSFRMYDIDGNGTIQEQEVMEVLEMMLASSIDHQHLVNIARRTLEEADKDGDRMITFEEFYKTLKDTDIDKNLSLRYFM